MKRSVLRRETPLRAKRDLRRYSGQPKRCDRCGGEYRPRTIGQRYCSQRCANRSRPSAKVPRTCGACGAEFFAYPSEVARGYGRFCSRRCAGLARPGTPPVVGRGAEHPAHKHGRAVSQRNTADYKRRFHSGQTTCQHPGCAGKSRRLAEHHVVYEQEIRRRKGDIADGRNALCLCQSCHAAHHHRNRPVLLRALRDENYEFAFELMGPAAYEYLRRRYGGSDPRLEAWLARIEGGSGQQLHSQQEDDDGEGRSRYRPEGDGWPAG